MNSVQIIGNLTREVELRFVGEKKTPIATLGVAVNNTRGKTEEVMFVDVDVWGAQAENCQKYLAKGRKIAVNGRLKQETWNDKDSGTKRSKILIVADQITFLGSNRPSDDAKSDSPAEEPAATTEPEAAPF